MKSESNRSFICPKCKNKTLYDITREVKNFGQLKNGDIMICDECASEFIVNCDKFKTIDE